MMIRNLVLTAVLSSGLTLLIVAGLGAPALSHTIKLENAKVRVVETVYAPGVPRERSIRQTDQVIVFLDDCRYERKDSQTGERTIRTRKAGDVIWHDKGEDAPQLTNTGSQPYRTLTIELK